MAADCAGVGGGNCVAGDHQRLYILRKQMVDGQRGQAADLVDRARAVGRIGVVAVIDEALIWQQLHGLFQYADAAYAAVQNTNRVLHDISHPFAVIICDYYKSDARKNQATAFWLFGRLRFLRGM